MGNKEHRKSKSTNTRTVYFSYIMGLTTGLFVIFVFSIFIVVKSGFFNFLDTTMSLMPFKSIQREIKHKYAMRLPQDILEELIELNATIENTDNPTKQKGHDTNLVRPDKELKYVIRPHVKTYANMLKSIRAYNLDPPILYLNKPNLKLSNKLQSYLKEESRLNYIYTTDANGFRRTLPLVDSPKKILIIGDSVAFGVGVDDEHTVASCLQNLIGKEYQILNAGVGGYSGRQAFLRAKQLSKNNTYHVLIYVACSNDFFRVKNWNGEAEDVFVKIKSIADRFNNKIIIMLHTYMEYNLYDIILYKGRSEEMITKTHSLRAALHKMSKAYGFKFHDWSDIVDNFMKSEKSIFSRFALYADHCHLSPLGNRLMAKEILPDIKQLSMKKESFSQIYNQENFFNHHFKSKLE